MMLHYLVIISQSNKDRSVIGDAESVRVVAEKEHWHDGVFLDGTSTGIEHLPGALQERASAA